MKVWLNSNLSKKPPKFQKVYEKRCKTYFVKYDKRSTENQEINVSKVEQEIELLVEPR